jgi:hypothetical protein
MGGARRARRLKAIFCLAFLAVAVGLRSSSNGSSGYGPQRCLRRSIQWLRGFFGGSALVTAAKRPIRSLTRENDFRYYFALANATQPSSNT